MMFLLRHSVRPCFLLRRLKHWGLRGRHRSTWIFHHQRFRQCYIMVAAVGFRILLDVDWLDVRSPSRRSLCFQARDGDGEGLGGVFWYSLLYGVGTRTW